MHEYFDILQSCLLLDTFKISLGEYRAAPTPPRGRDYILITNLGLLINLQYGQDVDRFLKLGNFA